MLAWMVSFGTLKRIGVEYGSELLRYFQKVQVHEVTAPVTRLVVTV